jgi:predicted phage gp36 major capsid-like protein
MRDDYTGADNGIVKIRARRRVGGAPVMHEAIAVLQGAAA